MDSCFTISDVYDVAIVFLLATFIFYSYIIYVGRHGKEEHIFLYFCLFSLNYLVGLLCATNLYRFIFPTKEIKEALSPAITGTSYFFLMHFALKIFKVIFNFSTTKKYIFMPFYISLTIFVALVSTYLFLDYNYYVEKIFPVETIFATFSPLYMYIYFIVYFNKSKKQSSIYKIDLSSILILVGFFIFMSEFFIEEALEVFNIEYKYKDTYVMSGISIFVWTYALSIKFNKEHRELKMLKDSLGKKVEVRTKALELANEQRTNTFINLAHEIRTPLTLANNSLYQFLIKYSEDSDIKMLKENIDLLNNHVNNFFIEEKFRMGVIPYNHDQLINLSEIIENKVTQFKKYSNSKSIDINPYIDKNIYLKADTSMPAAVELITGNCEILFTFSFFVLLLLIILNLGG